MRQRTVLAALSVSLFLLSAAVPLVLVLNGSIGSGRLAARVPTDESPSFWLIDRPDRQTCGRLRQVVGVNKNIELGYVGSTVHADRTVLALNVATDRYWQEARAATRLRIVVTGGNESDLDAVSSYYRQANPPLLRVKRLEEALFGCATWPDDHER